MYLWVIIATFITILASYNLSVRPDMDRAHAHTKAGVEITKFVVQHETALKYFAKIKEPEGESDVPATALKPGETYPKQVSDSDKEEEGSSEGSAPSSKFSDFLPFGLAEDKTVLSKVFCFPEETTGADGESIVSTDYSQQCDGNGPGEDPTKSCCAKNPGAIYVVSMKKIPSRWLLKNNDKNSSGIAADFLTTLKTTRDYARYMGYVAKSGDNYVVSGYKTDNSDGKEIFEAIAKDSDFKTMCVNKKCLYAFKKI